MVNKLTEEGDKVENWHQPVLGQIVLQWLNSVDLLLMWMLTKKYMSVILLMATSL
jgi:hypothetical protein